MALEGIVPVTLTPMHEDGSPDVEGIHSLVDYLCGFRLGGLYVLGTTSEHMNLTYAERLLTARTFVDAARGRLPLLMGASSSVVKEIFSFLDDIADLSVTGVHVILSNRHIDDARVIDTYSRLADRCAQRLWLYHNPRDYRGLTPGIVATLRDHPNIGGMKVGQFNLSEHQEFCALGRDDFEVIGAGGGQILPFLVNGARAVTCSTGCVWPDEHIEVWDLFTHGRIDEARQRQYELRDTLGRFELMQAGNGESCAEEKALLEIKGVCRRFVAPPFRSLTDAEVSRYREMWSAYASG